MPIGIGVNTGVAYVGAVGPGELVITESTAVASGIPMDARERRRLELRGKEELVDVVVLDTRPPARSG